ncbi:MAG TPA: transcriptional regulator GcvA [Usitatibacter sp.]|jgi:LysR family glycine cleavage system transcriptional activator|nr:transcriptional regulator GcvA [Usitatibacter sp.]
MPNPNGRQAPLNALRAFEAAARHLSFKNAAQELHVTAGAVSHQVKVLEDYLGVALFRRLTRALELTPEASAMLPKVREGLENLVEALERVRHRVATCSLTVVTPPNFAARWLVPRLARFTTAHPNVELHLASRAGMIDGRELDVRESGDGPVAMVRFGSGRYPGRHVDEVFAVRYVPVCSPRLLKGAHALRKPADLAFHTLLHDDTVTEGGARPSWADWLESAGVKDVDPTRGPRFSDASLALEAAIEGMGVTLAIKALVRSEIESGRLVVPFDISSPAAYAYYLVTSEADASQESIQAFRQWLLEEAAPELGAE